MSKIANFNEVHTVLRQFIQTTKTDKYDLSRITELMAKLGNPQDSYKVVHVAGTSGKTSTCYYAAALLQAAGQKVGLTVSPHIDEVNERVQINLKPLPENEFCQALSEFLDVITGTHIKPTYFELLVAFAYWYFAKQQVDYAVVEVGLGGLLDGTNVITRTDKVCLITDIGLDHTEVLGKTIAEIAAQKAGIIQKHNAVFMYRQSDEVMSVVTKRTTLQAASLYTINFQRQLMEKLLVKILDDLPPFQKRNFLLAKAVYEFIAQRDNVTRVGSADLFTAAHTKVPARMETVLRNGKTIILDGSHNGQKMMAVTDGIHKLYPHKKVVALVSFVESEDGRAKAALKVLKGLTDKLIVTSFNGEQDTPKHSVKVNKIVALARAENFSDIHIIKDPAKAFKELLNQPEPVLLVTGSFYLLNHIRPLILKP